tara:strand:+ start:470 stop:655 length:186 start_codon:yes stop_codon:yes gene_type:complete
MEDNNITRKEALKKMGKYAALTALGTMIMLEPAKAQRCSPPPSGSRGFGVRRSRKQGMFKK